MLLMDVADSVGEVVATGEGETEGEAVVVGSVAVPEGEVVAAAKLSGVGDAVATGEGEIVVGDGDRVVVGAIAVVEPGAEGLVVDPRLLGLGDVVATAFGEGVAVDSKEGEGLTEGTVGDKVAVGVGDRVGEAVVMGVTVSVTVVVSVSIVVADDSGVSASLLAVVGVELKTNEPTKVAIITPQSANNIPVFVAGDISSGGATGSTA